MKTSAQYTAQAKAEIDKGYNSDSITDWKLVKKLEDKALIASRSEELSQYNDCYERLEALVKKINEKSGFNLTIGYIGNDDDRSYSVLAPHPGRAGTNRDRFGCFIRTELHKLLSFSESRLEAWAEDHKLVNGY